jgi:2-enoate reductase
MKRKKLFEPISIRNLEVRNRIVLAPLNLSNMYPPIEGTIPQRVIDYYVERTKGGVGLIITGVSKVENEIENYQKDNVRIWPMITPSALPGLGELADRIHSLGGRIFVQLTAGPGRVAKGDVIDSGFTPVSASPNPAYFRPNVTCRELKTGEVDRMVEAFGRAAQMVAAVGIDGVEIHGHEGYLIDQFITALWNKRNDKYGGDLMGRLRFPIEILRVIRKTVGDSFPVTFRVGIKHFIREPWKSSLKWEGFVEAGRDREESIEVVKVLEEHGYDAFHMDTGCYDAFYWAHPPTYQPEACGVDLLRGVKNAVNVPIIAVNKLGNPTTAEEILQKDIADMVALGRPLLADPQWPNKVRGNREEDIRPCIGCHEGCFRLPVVQKKPTSCSVNPSCGKEAQYPLAISQNLKKVLVIGGGVAGMEAARVAAQRGHQVVLIEKSGHLGGHLREASVPDFKNDLKKLLGWYERQMKQLEIEIHMKTEVTAPMVKDADCDVAILATGSMPYFPDIPGIQKPSVTTCSEVLSGEKKVGKSVIILGGGLEGCETAVWLAQKGKSVRVVEVLEDVATDLHLPNRQMLLDMMEDGGIEILTESTVAEVLDDGVVLSEKASEGKFLACENVIVGVGLKPVRDLYDTLNLEGRTLYEVGDCKEARNLHYAILEGFTVGYYV